jgi:transketolase
MRVTGMRDVFCRSLVEAARVPEFVFLTGDLGFKALEPLREAMGTRFINAGVAEQNMVSVAAALAKQGLKSWAYSIAPFIYARSFEQVRNDVCLHDLPVVLVGNGGGYGYGVMGSTHHCLEDYGALLTLPNIRVFVPAFDGDVRAIVRILFAATSPAYLRLGLSEEPKESSLPEYSAWRKLCDGRGPAVLVVGPLVGGILAAVQCLPRTRRPNLWLLCELPMEPPPEQFLQDVHQSGHVIVVEEHVAAGGAGQILAHWLLTDGRPPKHFTHRYALGCPSGLYGSQHFHRQECGLDPASIVRLLDEIAS